jgi:hypothetical protein
VTFDDPAVAFDLNRDEHLVGASAFWKLLPRSDLRVSYNFGVKHFLEQSDRDVTRHIALVAVRGDLTAKLSSTFRIGVEHRTPESSREPGYTGLVMGGDFIYRPTDRTTVSLITDRSVQESTFLDVPFYISTSGSLIVEHRFWTRLLATARATVGRSEYPSKQTILGETKWRDDIYYAYGAGLDYEVRPWLTVGGEYAHLARRSNFDVFDFEDDRFTAKVTLSF